MMRFTLAWANVVSENQVLKLSIACLVVVLLGLITATVKLSNRKPLIVERACYSKTLALVDENRTPSETEEFVKKALAVRFDSNETLRPGYLDQREESFRNQEQQDFKKRDISQRIIVNKVTSEGGSSIVDADRLLSMGNVRTVLPFPLKLFLGTVNRSDANPYGLIILQVSAPKSDEKLSGEKNESKKGN